MRVQDGVFEPVMEQRAIRQVGKLVAVRESQDFLLTLGDAFAHVIERFGERADFVRAAHADRIGIVAVLNARRCLGQLSDRASDVHARWPRRRRWRAAY